MKECVGIQKYRKTSRTYLNLNLIYARSSSSIIKKEKKQNTEKYRMKQFIVTTFSRLIYYRMSVIICSTRQCSSVHVHMYFVFKGRYGNFQFVCVVAFGKISNLWQTVYCMASHSFFFLLCFIGMKCDLCLKLKTH